MVFIFWPASLQQSLTTAQNCMNYTAHCCLPRRYKDNSKRDIFEFLAEWWPKFCQNNKGWFQTVHYRSDWYSSCLSDMGWDGLFISKQKNHGEINKDHFMLQFQICLKYSHRNFDKIKKHQRVIASHQRWIEWRYNLAEC